VPDGAEPSESRTSTNPVTVPEFVFMTLTLARFPGSGSRPSMYMAKSSIPNDPPIIGIDRSDIVDVIPMNERPKAPPPPLLYTRTTAETGAPATIRMFPARSVSSERSRPAPRSPRPRCGSGASQRRVRCGSGSRGRSGRTRRFCRRPGRRRERRSVVDWRVSRPPPSMICRDDTRRDEGRQLYHRPGAIPAA